MALPRRGVPVRRDHVSVSLCFDWGSIALGDVENYLAALTQVRGLLREEQSSQSGVAAFASSYACGAIPKNGYLAGGVEYDFHSVGCRFVLPSGEVVDIKILDGVEVFDAWRVLLHASTGADSSDRGLRDVDVECSSLARHGKLVQIRRGWYSDLGRP